MWKDGIYLSQARGMAGFVKTELEISNNKITSVNLDLSTETPQYAQKAKSKLENVSNQQMSMQLVELHLPQMGLKKQ